jgi:hypothetical protein
MSPIFRLKLLAIIIAAVSCESKCDHPIDIFEGASFKKGQKYVLTIGEDELKRSENFLIGMSRGKYEKIGSYCCKKDSVKVQFTLGAHDTVFFISPKKTKRLLVGSYFDGNILVATDENPDAWIKM